MLVSLGVSGVVAAAQADDLRLELQEGWAIASSASVAAGGEAISSVGFPTAGWHPATVPTTVVAALVADGTFPDPDFGMNLRSIPGTSYPVGVNFANREMPEDSPFRVPWWYRTEFELPDEAAGHALWLRLGGVNYRFDAWLNGRRIAEAAATAGAFRVHEIDVTAAARPGRNALAVAVQAPRPDDLAITFVDWNPMPPDKMMGIYRPVTLIATGPVALAHPQVVTRLPALDRAQLTVKVFARNATASPITGTLRGRIGEAVFAQEVALGALESREVSFSPPSFPQLVVRNPTLWWPAQYGAPVLHTLELEFLVDGQRSDRVASRFGIREIASETTDAGHLVFTVNGRRILIRGAGWTPEMTLRYTRQRLEREIRYVRDLGLNTIRLEGKLEDDPFFEATDREGILVMAGWCCCDHWEKWEGWKQGDLAVATASLRDQILRLRGHASLLAWLDGSDRPPPANVEKAYLDVLSDLGFPDPVLSSATEARAEHSGPSGVKMRGPYDWVPPLYWYQDTTLGGAHGFATEVGPGPAPPPLESLKRFLPEADLWPIGPTWGYHCGGGRYKTLDVFDAALDARYGRSRDVAEYARKAQVAAYESHRAMFEAFGARKYTATGVIQWMLNNAWPGLIWHLYDFYLRPGGSYFGAKKALEPLHVQYSYDDRSVVVVNSTLREQRRLRVAARVLDLEGRERHRQRATLDVGADAAVMAFALPEPTGKAPTYFLFLTLDDATGRTLSRNVYWLSTTPEILDWAKSSGSFTPVARYADLTGLERLPPAEVEAAARLEAVGSEGRAQVVVRNRSRALAFFVHLAVRRGPAGDEVLPVLWDDNFVTLLPGESRTLEATYALADVGGAAPFVSLDGWNVAQGLAR
jgi:exo-1,4-beta-D-glucosaminidase